MADNFLGEIRSFAFSKIPKDWLPCDGRLLQVQEYPALYSLLGTAFGGNGKTVFAIPDLRGRCIMHPENNLSFRGETGGAETVTLTEQNMPQHVHSINPESDPNSCQGTLRCISDTPTLPTPVGNVNAGKSARSAKKRFNDDDNPDAQMQPGSVTLSGSTGMAGDGLPHENMSPFLVISYCIATTGYFPPRS